MPLAYEVSNFHMVRVLLQPIGLASGSAASCGWKKNVFFEKLPSKTPRKIAISKFMPGAVVKRSDTTLVIYGVFETRPSKTQGKLNDSKFIRGAVIKKSDMTTVTYNVSATLPLKIQSKVNMSEFQNSKTHCFVQWC